MTHALSPRLRAVVAALLAVLLLGGVAAECSGDGGHGMHQGGSDSEPHWH